MKIKTFIISCILAVLVSSSAVAGTMYTNSWDGVRLREKPNTNSDVIVVIKYGTEVDEGIKINDWSRVKYGDQFGYIKSEYLQEEDPLENMEYLGNWHTTAYAYTGSPCANGNMPSTGYTIACNSLDFGTKVYIEGVGMRVVEDRGPESPGSEWLDIYMGDVSSCIQWGSQYRDVYLVKDETEN